MQLHKQLEYFPRRILIKGLPLLSFRLGKKNMLGFRLRSVSKNSVFTLSVKVIVTQSDTQGKMHKDTTSLHFGGVAEDNVFLSTWRLKFMSQAGCKLEHFSF